MMAETNANSTLLDALVTRIITERTARPRTDRDLVLGHDNDTLMLLSQASRILVTLPHASPNVFFPRVEAGWYAYELLRQDPELLHLRVVLTHTNFSDLRWRPYAWWVLDVDRRLTRVSLFSRNKRRKHVVVVSQEPLTAVPSELSGNDAMAADLALNTANRAWSYITIMASIERACGFSIPGRTVYVAMDQLISAAWAAARHTPATPLDRWIRSMFTLVHNGRVVGEDGQLRTAQREEVPFVLDNARNLALLAALPAASVVGGNKAARFWPEIQAAADAASAASGVRLAAPRLRLRAQADHAGLVPPTPHLARELETAGIPYSQGMALALHGTLVEARRPS